MNDSLDPGNVRVSTIGRAAGSYRGRDGCLTIGSGGIRGGCLILHFDYGHWFSEGLSHQANRTATTPNPPANKPDKQDPCAGSGSRVDSTLRNLHGP